MASDHAFEKSANERETFAGILELAEEELIKCTMLICSNAHDAKDAALLLEAVGINIKELPLLGARA